MAGSSGEVARYKLGYLLSQASPYLLLLSATPHNGKTEPFLRLVRLLDEEAFPNAKSIVKEQVAPYLIRTEKREAIDNNGNKLFKNRVTHLVSLNWDERHTLQRGQFLRRDICVLIPGSRFLWIWVIASSIPLGFMTRL